LGRTKTVNKVDMGLLLKVKIENELSFVDSVGDPEKEFNSLYEKCADLIYQDKISMYIDLLHDEESHFYLKKYDEKKRLLTYYYEKK
jgi:hypothetical protein